MLINNKNVITEQNEGLPSQILVKQNDGGNQWEYGNRVNLVIIDNGDYKIKDSDEIIIHKDQLGSSNSFFIPNAEMENKYRVIKIVTYSENKFLTIDYYDLRGNIIPSGSNISCLTLQSEGMNWHQIQ